MSLEEDSSLIYYSAVDDVVVVVVVMWLGEHQTLTQTRIARLLCPRAQRSSVGGTGSWTGSPARRSGGLPRRGGRAAASRVGRRGG